MPRIDIVNAKNIIESNPEKAFFKLKNTGGPKGDTGAQGPQGPKGDTGAQGPAGASASVTVGSTTTLSPGADATVTNSGDTRNAILNFGIPTGARGPKGDTGAKGDTGPMGPKGAKGDTGAAATVQVGNTNTGAPGTNAQVTNAGNEHFAVFNFTIPRGDKGEKGATGAQGAKGDKGDKGDAGTAATITVGSTTTTNPGTNATVTNSGTTSAAVLNFGIPRGATGSVKSEVVSELPETGEEDTFYLANREATEQTATGKAINFTNSDNSGDITDFQLDGETSQNGTPTPDAPVAVNTTTGENVVKICGKNLFDSSATPDYVAQQAWEYFGNGTYTAITNGYYFESGYRAIAFEFDSLTVGQQYTLSFDAKGNSSHNAQVGVNMYTGASGGTQKNYTIDTTSTRISFTFTATSANRIAFNSGATSGADLTITNIQLELGSTATTYEPYQGQSYEVNLGKNLFDKDNANVLNGYVSSSAIVATNNDYTIWIPCEPNATYTIQKMNASPQATTRFRVATTEDEPILGRSIIQSTFWNPGDGSATNVHTITTAPNSHYLVINIMNKTATTTLAQMLASIQIERGSTSSSYSAYFTPIELCKIGDYQDYIYKSGGKWYVHKTVEKIALSSLPGWGRSENGKFFATSFASEYGVVAGDGYSDQFDYSGTAWSADYRFGITGSGNLWVATGDSTLTSTDLFNTWLQNHNPVAYFQLAASTDTEITNATLITQLDNVASAPLYTGVNNITTITPNEQGTLEIKYVTYDKYNQNKVYIWNDTLQQWQIIVQ